MGDLLGRGELTSADVPAVALAFHPGLEPLLFEEQDWLRLEGVARLADRAALGRWDAPESAERLAEARVLLTGWGCPPIDAAALSVMPRLELVAHAAGTVKDFVTDALWERGVRVTSAATANAVPVAEYTLATILLANKDAFGASQRYHSQGAAAAGVRGRVGNLGKTVGIVGASRVGRLVIEMLRPFDLRVLLADPFVDEAEAQALGVTLVALDALLELSDVVSLHAPLLPETTGLIGEAELARMRDGATLINTARGRVCETAALERALVSGRINAVLDTTDPEPLPDDTPLRGLTNVFVTPHIAGSLGNEIPRMTRLAIDEIERFARGEALQHEVQRDDLGRVA